MPDYLAQYQDQQAQALNQQLGDAMHAASWVNTFANTPSDAVLRANRNVTDLVKEALARKAEIEAQTSQNAMAIYERSEKHAEWRRQEPQRDQLLQAQIDAEGASTRYRQQKDAETTQDVAGFYNDLASIKSSIGTPDHAGEFLQVLKTHPLAASTASVRDDIKLHSQVHDSASALNNIPDGYEAAQIQVGDNGKQNVVFRPKSGAYTSKADVLASNPNAIPRQNARGQWYDDRSEANARQPVNPLQAELHQGYSLTSGQLLNPVAIRAGKLDDNGAFTNAYNDAANGPVYEIQTGNPKSARVLMSRPEFERFKAGLSPSPTGKTDGASPQDASSGPPKISSREDYAALPSGSVYTAPDGSLRKKP